MNASVRSWRNVLIGAVLALTCVVVPSTADAQLELRPSPNSRIWIHGEATTHDFSCVVTEVNGSAQIAAPEDTVRHVTSEGKNEDGRQNTVEVQVPIRAFDCGNARMTKDLQEALKMKENPEIKFELVHATMGVPSDTSAQWRRVDALGPLTIAGTKRLTRLHAAARALDDERFRLRGCVPIRMTYFGIDPPTKALGLIKVKNRVEVKFDLLAESTSADPSSATTRPLTNPPPCDE